MYIIQNNQPVKLPIIPLYQPAPSAAVVDMNTPSNSPSPSPSPDRRVRKRGSVFNMMNLCKILILLLIVIFMVYVFICGTCQK
jgi:hypothetical protein